MYQPRSKLYSTGAISLVAAIVVFLLVAPAVEREAHLSTLESGEPGAWPAAVKSLCWIESGRLGMIQLLPRLDVERRIGILRVVRKEGCLDMLGPELEATFFVYAPQGPSSAEAAIASGRAAIEPAMEALSSDDPEVQRHAMYVLGGVAERLDAEQRSAILAKLEEMRASRLRNTLMVGLGADADAESADTGDGEDVEQRRNDATTGAEERLEPRVDPDFQLREPKLELRRGAGAGRVLYRDDVPADDVAKPENSDE